MVKKSTIFEAAGLIKNVPKLEKGGKISAVEKEIARIEKPVEEKVEPKEDKSAILIGKMFRLRDTMHLLHLKSEKYSEHKILNKFYTNLLDLTDTLAEVMQQDQLMDIKIPSSNLKDADAVKYIKTFKTDIISFKDNCSRDDVKALLDEVNILCSSTLYKLKFLR